MWTELGLSDVIVVTGGKEPGDLFTEATAGATYLAAKRVPQAQILREVQRAQLLAVT